MKYRFIIFLTLLASAGRAQDSVIHIALTSDVHYGITRPHFRGADSVPATLVNQAMIAAIDRLPGQHLPNDSGVAAGGTAAAIDALVITGDIANRGEKGIQSAAASWQQFEKDYTHELSIRDHYRRPTPLYLLAGNHDASNAIGYCRPIEAGNDASSMAALYNRMINPARARDKNNYNYTTDKVHYSRDIEGIHLLFVNLWPDLAEQQWMESDLSLVPPGTPVLLFAHSMPDVDARFFTNPNGTHSINEKDRFENLLPEIFQDGPASDQPATREERGLAAFLQRHPNIRAWFHGHNNYNEYYSWPGPDKNLSLPCFRVDSPMKGRWSAKDETLLSFQLISIDTRTKKMTVRECRWNTRPDQPSVLEWGDHLTIYLAP